MLKTNRINKNDVSWDPTSSSVPWEFQVLLLNGSMRLPLISKHVGKAAEVYRRDIVELYYLVLTIYKKASKGPPRFSEHFYTRWVTLAAALRTMS